MTATSAAAHPGRMDELESLRGLAALLVALHHIPPWSPELHGVALIRNAYLMVDLFFVLSGFVIWTAYSGRIRSARDLVCFQFLRFARLYPVHILMLGAFVALECLKYFAASRYGVASPNSTPFERNNIEAFWQQVLLVQAIAPGAAALTFNAPAWSISVEFWMYLLFGLVVLTTGRMRDAALSALAVAAFVLLALDGAGGLTLFAQCVAGFCLGCMVARAHAQRLWQAPSWAAPVALAAFTAFIALKPERVLDLAVYPLAAVAILALVSAPRGALHGALTWRPLVWLGAVSYALYMTHTLVIWIVSQMVRVGLKRPEAMIGDGATPQLSTPEAALASVLVIGVTLIAAAAVHRYVETPARLASRRWIAGGRATGPALA